GLVTLCHPAELSPAALRAKVAVALHCSRNALRERAHTTLDFDGARRAAASLVSVAQLRDQPGPPDPECLAMPRGLAPRLRRPPAPPPRPAPSRLRAAPAPAGPTQCASRVAIA